MQRPSKSSDWNLDVVQTLVRAVLKIGGGYLLAKGLANESTLEAVTAGAVALAAIVWGVGGEVALFDYGIAEGEVSEGFNS